LLKNPPSSPVSASLSAIQARLLAACSLSAHPAGSCVANCLAVLSATARQPATDKIRGQPTHSRILNAPSRLAFPDMSIKEGVLEAGQDDPAARASMFRTVTKYIIAAGLPTSLTQHATEVHHEDVPHEIGPDAADFAKTRTPSPVTETIAPGRLRSLFPPANYGVLVPGAVYRSSYPQPKNYEFLQSLNLKTIITLVPEEIPAEYGYFMQSAHIQHFQVHLNANKGGVRIQSCDMNRALNIVLDRSNHPLLIHCNKGKHRTGCLSATLRKIQGRSMSLLRRHNGLTTV
jgi:tyrosine-protein phosphatase SIW14